MKRDSPERYITQDTEGIDRDLEQFIVRIEREVGSGRQQLFEMGLVRIVYQKLLSRHSLEPLEESNLVLIYYGETPAAAIFQTRDELNFTITHPVWLGIHNPGEL